jgi:hypothetical protein
MFSKVLSSNGLFRIATGMCPAKRRPSDYHIPAFRRHVTIDFRVREMKKRKTYIEIKRESRKKRVWERKKEGRY